VFFSLFTSSPFIISGIVFLIQRPVSFTNLTRNHCGVSIVTFWAFWGPGVPAPLAPAFPLLLYSHRVLTAHPICLLGSPAGPQSFPGSHFGHPSPVVPRLQEGAQRRRGLSVWRWLDEQAGLPPLWRERSGIRWVGGGGLHPSEVTSGSQSSLAGLQRPGLPAAPRAPLQRSCPGFLLATRRHGSLPGASLAEKLAHLSCPLRKTCGNLALPRVVSQSVVRLGRTLGLGLHSPAPGPAVASGQGCGGEYLA